MLDKDWSIAPIGRARFGRDAPFAQITTRIRGRARMCRVAGNLGHASEPVSDPDCSASRVEQGDDPSGASYPCSQSLGSLSQRTICCHKRHLTGSIGRHSYEHVVTTARCMENSDTVSDALLDAAASSTFEDHDNGYVALRHRGARLIIVLTTGTPDAASGRLDHLAFAVPDEAALRSWADHLTGIGIAHDPVVLELGNPSLQLRDPDDIAIELVAPGSH